MIVKSFNLSVLMKQNLASPAVGLYIIYFKRDAQSFGHSGVTPEWLLGAQGS